MKAFLTATLLLFSVVLFAQDQTIKNLQAEGTKKIDKGPADTAQKTWKKGGIFSFNIAQSSLSNWAAGGDDFSMSLTTYLNLYAYYKKGKHSWDNTLNINLAYINSTSLGTRKNDDRFDILSKYGYALNPKLNLSGLFNFRSQMFKGYNYPTDNTKELSSDFLSPAYVLLSPGLDYHPVKNLSIFVSPASVRWAIVKNDSLSAKGLYGVDSGKHVKTEFGAFATINYTANITKALTYTGRLDLFSNYLKNPQNIDVNFTNLFAVKISKVISATWSIDLIYDDDAKLFGPGKDSPRTQFKSVVGAGLMVKL